MRINWKISQRYRSQVLKRYHLIFFSALAVLSSILGFSQDYIQDLSYTEYHEYEAEAFKNGQYKKLQKITYSHIKKAKVENNNIELARAYYYRTFSEDLEHALAYSDSIIEVTQESNHSNFPTLGYIIKGRIQYNSGDFQVALDNLLKAYKLALQKENMQHQREITLAIGAVKNVNGQHASAAQLYKKSLDQIKLLNNYELEYYEDYLVLLFNLSLTHIRMNQLDSAKIYSDTGINLTRFSEDHENYRDFILIDAQINFLINNLKPAKDSLIKYVGELKGTDLAYKYYYLGKINSYTGEEEIAVGYFEKIDSILSVTQDPFHEIKDVYQSLIINSSLKNDKKNQLKYIDKLIHYDSILNAKQMGILNKAELGFEVPYLKHQKDLIERQLFYKGAVLNGLGILFCLLFLSGLYFYHKDQTMRNKIKILLDLPSPDPPVIISEHPENIPVEVREEVLNRLKDFEDSEEYLRKDLDLGILAQRFNTNTTYLSAVINHYKGMNFPSYLKDLKISTAIKRLSTEPELLRFNYQGLAELFGFKTAESFSKAFYKKTGVYPSKFLAELKNRKKKLDSHL